MYVCMRVSMSSYLYVVVDVPIPSDNVFHITLGTKTAANDYYSTAGASTKSFFINGIEAGHLLLHTGVTYTFTGLNDPSVIGYPVIVNTSTNVTCM